jgi:hypothetical protein
MIAPNWRPVSELIAPVEYSWRLVNNGEEATIKLQLDLRRTAVSLDELRDGLENLWRHVWAPLVTESTLCITTSAVPLLASSGGISFVPPLLRGSITGPASPRRDSCVISTYAGGRGSAAQRRMYIPFIPQGWVSGDVLTANAFSRILTAMRGLVLGCDGLRGGTGPAAIVFHPSVPRDRWRVARDPEWAPVEQMIVNAYVDRAPGPT